MKVANREFLGPFDVNSEGIPNVPAVYLLVENGEVVYTGLTGRSLRDRLSNHPVLVKLMSESSDVQVYCWPFNADQLNDAISFEREVYLIFSPKLNVRRATEKIDNTPSTTPYLSAQLYLFLILRRLFSRRFQVLIGSIAATLAGLLLFSSQFSYYVARTFNAPEEGLSPAAFTSLLVALASFSLLYLQSGGQSEKNSSISNEIARLKAKNIRLDHALSEMKAQFSEQLEDVEKREAAEHFSDSDRAKVLDEIAKKATTDAIKEVFALEFSQLQAEAEKKLEIDKLRVSSAGILDRMRREIADLRLRANINLVIGMAITAGGLYLLWTTVSIVDSSELLKQLANEDGNSDVKFFKSLLLPMVPRIMLVIFLEIFAYFFLQLYKSGLAEIKYFQNELTNVESRVLSVEFACMTGCREHLKTALDSLAQTERNFILTRGQTTVELEKAKAEAQSSREFLKLIPDLFKSKG